MTIKNSLAGVAVKDLDAAIRWYTKLLDRKPDARPMDELAEWKFSSGGWMQVFTDSERAGSSSITLVETDLASRLEFLAKAGIHVRNQSDGDYVKTAIVRDPDGNQIVFAESTSPANAAAS
jgi:catechol 2,3-dioxygenase-like lactoylglutathione lyase family enzyme